MPETNAKILSELVNINNADMIPVILFVVDKESNTTIDQHTVGCYVMPRRGEIIDYKESHLEVYAVEYKFVNTKNTGRHGWVGFASRLLMMPEWIQQIVVWTWELKPEVDDTLNNQ